MCRAIRRGLVKYTHKVMSIKFGTPRDWQSCLLVTLSDGRMMLTSLLSAVYFLSLSNFALGIATIIFGKATWAAYFFYQALQEHNKNMVRPLHPSSYLVSTGCRSNGLSQKEHSVRPTRVCSAAKDAVLLVSCPSSRPSSRALCSDIIALMRACHTHKKTYRYPVPAALLTHPPGWQ